MTAAELTSCAKLRGSWQVIPNVRSSFNRSRDMNQSTIFTRIPFRAQGPFGHNRDVSDTGPARSLSRTLFGHLPTAAIKLMKGVRTLLSLLYARKLLLEPEYIASEDNITVGCLSLLSTKEDYHLTSPISQRIQDRFGTRTFDRFASSYNRQTTQYNSWNGIGQNGEFERLSARLEGEAELVQSTNAALSPSAHLSWGRPNIEAIILTLDWP